MLSCTIASRPDVLKNSRSARQPITYLHSRFLGLDVETCTYCMAVHEPLNLSFSCNRTENVLHILYNVSWNLVYICIHDDLDTTRILFFPHRWSVCHFPGNVIRSAGVPLPIINKLQNIINDGVRIHGRAQWDQFNVICLFLCVLVSVIADSKRVRSSSLPFSFLCKCHFTGIWWCLQKRRTSSTK